MDHQDRELRGHLRDVLVGGLRQRMIGAGLFVVGVALNATANLILI